MNPSAGGLRRLVVGLLLAQLAAMALAGAIPVATVAKRAASGNGTTGSDLSTDFAKQVIRLAKVADMRAYMDESVDPCTDFYKFACGNWPRVNPAQLLTTVMTDTFKKVQKAFERKIRMILKTPRSDGGGGGGDDDGVEVKVKNFYEACVAVGDNMKGYRAELRGLVDEFGGMPALRGHQDQDKNETDAELVWWRKVAKIQRRYGLQIVMGATIMGDFENNTVNSVYLGPPDYDDVANTKLMNILQSVQTTHVLEKVLGLPSAEAQTVADEMQRFERDLVHGGTSSSPDLSLKDMAKRYTVADLQQKTGDALNVTEYLAIVLDGYVPAQVYLFDDDYWTNMLAVVASRPARVVGNYIAYHLLEEFLVEAKQLEAWCTRKTKTYFGKYLNNLVYSRFKNVAIERDVAAVWQEVRDVFRENLRGDRYDWMRNETREYAIEKLDAMQLEINSYENEDFAKEYAGLRLTRASYVENMRQVLEQQTYVQLAKMNSTAISFEDMDVTSFTPIYNILDNHIKIPVALLQPLYFWDANYPQAIKYATLGYLIAHEMVHGFDEEGRKHGKDGNYREWWDAKSTYEFESRRKCFQAQYHDYEYDGRRLPESVAQSENMADNAGIKLAYAAYMKWWQRQQDDDVLAKETFAGLDYNNRQLFFIAFAQVWCEDVQFLFKTSLAAGDTHAPGMYRVIGSLSNFQEFSWVFKCHPEAPMDPEYKCAIY